ncbi:MAG TPA: hypothetical protein VIA18_00480 [Polyangia bacterium]|nr:hypothetical protein [Polyangia bacterium]
MSVLVVVCAAAVATPARADDVEKQVIKMNKRAMDDYDSLEFESSRRTLLDAVQQLRSNGLDDGPTAAKTYLNLGIVYINGFKDRNRGQQQFLNALKIDAQIKVDPTEATPETDEAYAAAKRQLAASAPVTPTPPEEPTPPPQTTPAPPSDEVHGLVHNAVDESRPNAPIPIRAKLGSDVGATRVFLFYRGSGQEDFVSVPLKNTSGVDWVSVIPGDAVVGKSLQYYLEARDARGRAVVGAGSAMNPFIILITDTAPPPQNVPEVDLEDPLARERMVKRKREDEKHSSHDHVFIFVMPGFGFGVQPKGNHTEVAYQFKSQYTAYVPTPINSTGTAVAPFHIGVELGYSITPSFSLSLLGRFQVVTGGNAETQKTDTTQGATSKAGGAVAGFLRARYRFLDGRFHPYIHADIGGGQIRQYVDISSGDTAQEPLVDKYTADSYNHGSPAQRASLKLQTVCSNPKNCLDTVPLGLVFLGGGGGLWYDIGSHLAFIVDINILGAISSGSSESGLNIDAQIGLGVHFL